jgi:hypothetical protein
VWRADVKRRSQGASGKDTVSDGGKVRSFQLFIVSNTGVERQCRRWQFRDEYLEVIASYCIAELTSSRSNTPSDQTEVPDVHDPTVYEEYGVVGRAVERMTS